MVTELAPSRIIAQITFKKKKKLRNIILWKVRHSINSIHSLYSDQPVMI